MDRRWDPFFFSAALETFVARTGPRIALAGCLFLRDDFLELGYDTCAVVGGSNCLLGSSRGEFGAEGDRSASPCSNLTKSMSADAS